MIRRKLAIFVSGRGSNMEAILQASKDPFYPLEPILVISNRKNALALDKIKKYGVKGIYVNDGKDFEKKVLDILKKYEIEIIALAGFMKILKKEVLKEYKGKILNIHPSLLPSFKGLEAQRQAFEHGVKVSGCTVHIVDEGVDTGVILEQACVYIGNCKSKEEVSEKILKKEHEVYPKVLCDFAMNVYRIQREKSVRVNMSNYGELYKKIHFGIGSVPDHFDVAVSACLLGIPCRYDGNSKAHKGVLKYVKGKKVLPVCPEVLGGMWTPRTPMIVHGPVGKKMWEKGAKAISEDGEDRTQKLFLGASRGFDIIKNAGVDEVIVKERSPSCGFSYIHTPDGLKKGHGAFVEKLLNLNNIKIKTEEEFE